MKVLLVRGDAWTPQSFWTYIKIDPETEKEKYNSLIKAGYVKSIKQDEKNKK